MDEIIVAIFTFTVGLVLVFVQPVQNTASNIDTAVQTVVNEDVTDFVDNTRAQGYITGQDYQELISKLADTGNAYNITITLDSSQYYPDEDHAGEYLNGYSSDSQIEIVNDLGDMTVSDKYKMKAGDYLRVKVTQTNKSVAQKLQNIFLATSSSPTINVTYGGSVGNEAD